MPEPVLYALADNVATITLNRPDRLNALSPELFEAWQAALDRAESDGARAIVHTGEGRAFCSGADLMVDPSEGDGLDLADPIDRFYNPLARRLAALEIPVVNAVNGPAVGAGMGFALAGDIIVAARSAYFLFAFVNMGMVPDAGATWLVANAVGRARTLELALLGERLEAVRALEMGLVNRVVDDGQALPTAQGIAAQLAKGPSIAIGMIRQQVGFALDNDLETVLEREKRNQSRAGKTADFLEAVQAFGEKRPAKFQGK